MSERTPQQAYSALQRLAREQQRTTQQPRPDVTLAGRCEAAGRGRKIRDVRKTAPPSAKKLADPVRAARLRHDAQRAMSTNLAEGIALSHKLLRFTGAAARGR